MLNFIKVWQTIGKNILLSNIFQLRVSWNLEQFYLYLNEHHLIYLKTRNKRTPSNCMSDEFSSWKIVKKSCPSGWILWKVIFKLSYLYQQLDVFSDQELNLQFFNIKRPLLDSSPGWLFWTSERLLAYSRNKFLFSKSYESSQSYGSISTYCYIFGVIWSIYLQLQTRNYIKPYFQSSSTLFVTYYLGKLHVRKFWNHVLFRCWSLFPWIHFFFFI